MLGCKLDDPRPIADSQRGHHHDESLRTLRDHRDEGAIELTWLPHILDLEFDPEALRGTLQNPQIADSCGTRAVHENGDPRDLWHHLPQQFKPLATELLPEKERKPGKIAAGSAQTRDESYPQGIARNEDDRGRGGAILGRERGVRADRQNDPRVESYQFANEFRKASAATFGPSRLDGHVLAVRIAVLSHALTKRIEEVLIGGRRLRANEPDTGACGRLLCVQGGRRNSDPQRRQ